MNQYNEIEGCLNINWIKFIEKLDFIPLQLPASSKKIIEEYFARFDIDGVILTGGNDVYYNNEIKCNNSKLSKIRNEIENRILKICIKKKIPVLGVCRGMQFINKFFGGSLSIVLNHSGNHKHLITNCRPDKYNFPNKVNTYHNFGIPHNFNSKFTEILALDKNKNIEAFCHFEKKILGIMWHPEREKPFNKIDLDLVKGFFY